MLSLRFNIFSKKNKIKMKKYQILFMSVPLICALLSEMGYGSNYKYAVSFFCGCILCLTYGKKITKDVWIIVLAFMFSILGGWFLSNRRGMEIRFIYGILYYFIAHMGFLWFSLKNGKINKWILCGTTTAYLIFYVFMLNPSIESKVLTLAVLFYLLISCISIAAAIGNNMPTVSKWLFASGIFSLLFSDTLIAFYEFLGHQDLYLLLMMPTYFLSHILITFALLPAIRYSKN